MLLFEDDDLPRLQGGASCGSFGRVLVVDRTRDFFGLKGGPQAVFTAEIADHAARDRFRRIRLQLVDARFMAFKPAKSSPSAFMRLNCSKRAR